MNEELTQQVGIEIEQPPILLDNVQPPSTGDPWAVWRTEQGVHTDVPQLEEMEPFLGIQELGKWVFLMKSKYVEPSQVDPNNPFLLADKSEESAVPMMSICIDKAEVGELQVKYLHEWREEAVRRILAEAEDAYIENDLDRSAEPAHPVEKQMLFAVQRRRSKIAKVTRRGMGNVIIGTSEALKQLSVGEEWSKHFWSGFRVMEVPEGYAGTEGDFAVIGYKGSNKYDTSLALSLAPRPMKSGKYFGSIVAENISKYWKRII